MFVLFPNQLFDIAIIQAVAGTDGIVLYEEPIFFGDRPKRLFLNKLRLTYQRYLCEKFVATNPKVRYIKYDAADKFIKTLKKQNVRVFDPMDHAVLNKLKRACDNLTVLDTPAFVLPSNDEYIASKKGKRLRHAPFFRYIKSKLHILEDTPNQDIKNRVAFTKDTPVPPLPFPDYTDTNDTNQLSQQLLTKAKEWVEQHPIFRNNPGDIDLKYLAQLPSTPKEAIIWLHKFLSERLSNFGRYQDAISDDHQWLYHSGLSICLNYGLLTPHDILHKTVEYHQKHPVALNSYEGFIRQVLGWREYCRMYYICVPAKIYNQNHFKMTKTKLGKEWYTGSTGLPIVDKAIQDGWKYGYLHHIRRLMVLANYMTISRIHPDNVYRWMYEFSLDSNDVYMVFNCYSMGTYADGGYATHKAYVSGPGYIKRQFKEPSGKWEEEWSRRYHAFKGHKPQAKI